MKIVPIHLHEAKKFILQYHRHNIPPVGSKFSIGATDGDKLVGVAVCGRPISKNLDDGKTLEILRVCTDGTKNATSFLYQRCKRIGQQMGYEKFITYTLQSESGSSLKAIGAVQEKKFEGRQWTPHQSVNRSVKAVHDLSKIRWAI